MFHTVLYMVRVAVIVRGHVRKALADPSFAEYLRGLAGRLGRGTVVRAFVHTWCESEAKSSHRPLDRTGVRPVTEAEVVAYLGSDLVEWAAVDDDAAIQLPGNAAGRIGGIPARAWKNMWYGKHRALQAVEASGQAFDAVVCVRIDNFLNMESKSYARVNKQSMDAAVRSVLRGGAPDRVRFALDEARPGIDNFYAARPAAMARLIRRFHLEMDAIRSRYPAVRNQEYMVFYEARKMEPRPPIL